MDVARILLDFDEVWNEVKQPKRHKVLATTYEDPDLEDSELNQ